MPPLTKSHRLAFVGWGRVGSPIPPTASRRQLDCRPRSKPACRSTDDPRFYAALTQKYRSQMRFVRSHVLSFRAVRDNTIEDSTNKKKSGVARFKRLVIKFACCVGMGDSEKKFCESKCARIRFCPSGGSGSIGLIADYEGPCPVSRRRQIVTARAWRVFEPLSRTPLRRTGVPPTLRASPDFAVSIYTDWLGDLDRNMQTAALPENPL
jgi:hypothetical protein